MDLRAMWAAVGYPFTLFAAFLLFLASLRLILETLYALEGWCRRAREKAKLRHRQATHMVPVERLTEAEYARALAQIRPPARVSPEVIELWPEPGTRNRAESASEIALRVRTEVHGPWGRE